jgi:hypothetical protein
MANKYTESEMTLFSSFIMMEVAAMNADNEINKFHGKAPKYDARDFMDVERNANRKMRDY